MLPVRFIHPRHSDTVSPFDSLARWSRVLDGVFDPILKPGSLGGFPLDVRQDGDDLVIEAELPGVKRDDLDVTVEEDVLTISASSSSDTEDKGEGYYVRERRCGKVSRSLNLPNTTDVDKVVAQLTNGVLTLRIPAKEGAKPRQIDVN